MEFNKIIRLLAPLMVEGVLSVQKNSHDRLVEMLHELQFMTRSITKTNDHVIIELQILDTNLLYRLLAGEANKFLLASRISYERSTQDQKNNASWQAIEHYYAAYYGVHYIIRLTGVSLTNIDARGITSILRSNYGAHPDFTIPGGLYFMQYDDSSKILTLKKSFDKKSGGSHQDAWKLWEELIKNLHSRTNTDPVEYLSTSIELSEHKKSLTRSTAKYNPPEIRGEINYQFKGGSWIFEKKSAKSIGILQRLITNSQLLPITKTSTPEGLIAINKIIIELAKEVFLHAANKYPKGICRNLLNKYSKYI